MLASVPWQDFAVPPTLLVHSVLSGYRVEIAGQIAHIELGSSVKNPAHNRLIIDTIIGDCLKLSAFGGTGHAQDITTVNFTPATTTGAALTSWNSFWPVA